MGNDARRGRELTLTEVTPGDHGTEVSPEARSKSERRMLRRGWIRPVAKVANPFSTQITVEPIAGLAGNHG